MSLKDRFLTLHNQRSQVLETARECARLTIPSVLPPDDSETTEENSYPEPYQSTGAKGVYNLASKINQTLFPPTEPFVRLTIDELQLPQEYQSTEARQEVEQVFAEVEEKIQQQFDDQVLRSKVHEALEHTVITGNGCIKYLSSGGLKSYRLDRYVVQRDDEGTLVELIIKEGIAYGNLSKDLQSKVWEAWRVRGKQNDLKEETNIQLFTQYKKSKKKWVWTQELDDGIFVDKGDYKDDDTFPFIVLRWRTSPEEHYGRGLVEQYLGSLKTLESYSKSMVEATVIASRINPAIRPDSPLKPKKFMGLANGEAVSANPEDVSYIKMDKLPEFQWIYSMIQDLKKELNTAFLSFESVTRQAERVTAEEIRIMTQALESTLGGVYTLLVAQLQRPLAVKIFINLQGQKKIPEIANQLGDEIRFVLTTGLINLGRTADFQRLMTFLQIAQQNPEMAQVVKWGPAARKAANDLRVGTDIIYSDEELKAIQQQAMQQQILLQQMQQRGGGQQNGSEQGA